MVINVLLFSINGITIAGAWSTCELIKYRCISGNAMGIIENENEKPVWIISGNWTTNLSNQTQNTDNTSIFDMSFKMIKTNDTSKMIGNMTDLDIIKISNQNNNNNNNNSTIFNGTGVINMSKGPVKVSLQIYLMNHNFGILSTYPDNKKQLVSSESISMGMAPQKPPTHPGPT